MTPQKDPVPKKKSRPKKSSSSSYKKPISKKKKKKSFDKDEYKPDSESDEGAATNLKGVSEPRRSNRIKNTRLISGRKHKR